MGGKKKDGKAKPKVAKADKAAKDADEALLEAAIAAKQVELAQPKPRATRASSVAQNAPAAKPGETDEIEEIGIEEVDGPCSALANLPSLEVGPIDAVPSLANISAASAAYSELGCCVLQPTALVAPAVLEGCRRDVRPRLEKMQSLARRYADQPVSDAVQRAREKDPQLAAAAAAGGLQYKELYTRNGKENRFDVALVDAGGAWVGGASESGEAEAAWRALFGAVDALVQPVLRSTAAFAEAAAEIESAGFITSYPGAPVQNWHPDEALTLGLATAFVPLVDLDACNGPTELALATHLDPATPNRVLRYDFSPQHACTRDAARGWTPRHPSGLLLVKPLLTAGQLLLFDWRTWHRGGPNNSQRERPIAYVTYHAKGVQAHKYKQALVSLTAWEQRVEAEKAAAERATAQEAAARAAAEKAVADEAAAERAAEQRTFVLAAAVGTLGLAIAVVGGIAAARRPRA